MKTIYKYNVEITDRQEIELPTGAQLLCVQEQNNTINIWALVESDAKSEIIVIEAYGTGHPYALDTDRERQYIGTVQIYGGAQVYHFFKRL